MKKIVLIIVLLIVGIMLINIFFTNTEEISTSKVEVVKQEKKQDSVLNQTEVTTINESKTEARIESVATTGTEDHRDNEVREIVVDDEVDLESLNSLNSLKLPSIIIPYRKLLIKRLRDPNYKSDMPLVDNDTLLKKLRGKFVGSMVNTKTNVVHDLKLENSLEFASGKLRGTFEIQWLNNGSVFLTEEHHDTVFGPFQSPDEIWIRINSGCYYQIFYLEKEDRFVGNYYYQFNHKGFFELGRSN